MSICIIKSERRKNEKLRKEGEMRTSILNSIYTVHCLREGVHQTLAPIGTEKSVTDISIGEKEK